MQPVLSHLRGGLNLVFSKPVGRGGFIQRSHFLVLRFQSNVLLCVLGPGEMQKYEFSWKLACQKFFKYHDVVLSKVSFFSPI